MTAKTAMKVDYFLRLDAAPYEVRIKGPHGGEQRWIAKTLPELTEKITAAQAHLLGRLRQLHAENKQLRAAWDGVLQKAVKEIKEPL